MKRSKLLIVAVLVTFTSLAYSPAKAATTTQTTSQSNSLLGGLGDWLNGLLGGGSNSGSGSTSGTNSGTSGSPAGTALPINGGIWFLVLAGGVIGSKVIMSRKSLASQTQKI